MFVFFPDRTKFALHAYFLKPYLDIAKQCCLLHSTTSVVNENSSCLRANNVFLIADQMIPRHTGNCQSSKVTFRWKVKVLRQGSNLIWKNFSVYVNLPQWHLLSFTHSFVIWHWLLWPAFCFPFVARASRLRKRLEWRKSHHIPTHNRSSIIQGLVWNNLIKTIVNSADLEFTAFQAL